MGGAVGKATPKAQSALPTTTHGPGWGPDLLCGVAGRGSAGRCVWEVERLIFKTTGVFGPSQARGGGRGRLLDLQATQLWGHSGPGAVQVRTSKECKAWGGRPWARGAPTWGRQQREAAEQQQQQRQRQRDGARRLHGDGGRAGGGQRRGGQRAPRSEEPRQPTRGRAAPFNYPARRRRGGGGGGAAGVPPRRAPGPSGTLPPAPGRLGARCHAGGGSAGQAPRQGRTARGAFGPDAPHPAPSPVPATSDPLPTRQPAARAQDPRLARPDRLAERTGSPQSPVLSVRDLSERE